MNNSVLLGCLVCNRNNRWLSCVIKTGRYEVLNGESLNMLDKMLIYLILYLIFLKCILWYKIIDMQEQSMVSKSCNYTRISREWIEGQKCVILLANIMSFTNWYMTQFTKYLMLTIVFKYSWTIKCIMYKMFNSVMSVDTLAMSPLITLNFINDIHIIIWRSWRYFLLFQYMSSRPRGYAVCRCNSRQFDNFTRILKLSMVLPLYFQDRFKWLESYKFDIVIVLT